MHHHHTQPRTAFTLINLLVVIAIIAVLVGMLLRGEYEITDAMSQLAAGSGFVVVETGYWLPIGTVAQWECTQTADIGAVRRGV